MTGALAKWPALAAAAPEEQTGYAVFTAAQAASMGSLVELLIPADDYAGAEEAGVVEYIDRKLTGPRGSHTVALYHDGLTRLDEVCLQKFATTFLASPSHQQIALLEWAEQKTLGAELHSFFEAVLSDAFEGYYGSPEDGGNRNGLSWKMIGFKG